jgi:hypothetical protein
MGKALIYQDVSERILPEFPKPARLAASVLLATGNSSTNLSLPSDRWRVSESSRAALSGKSDSFAVQN